MQIAEKLLIIWTWAALLKGRTADWSARDALTLVGLWRVADAALGGRLSRLKEKKSKCHRCWMCLEAMRRSGCNSWTWLSSSPSDSPPRPRLTDGNNMSSLHRTSLSAIAKTMRLKEKEKREFDQTLPLQLCPSEVNSCVPLELITSKPKSKGSAEAFNSYELHDGLNLSIIAAKVASFYFSLFAHSLMFKIITPHFRWNVFVCFFTIATSRRLCPLPIHFEKSISSKYKIMLSEEFLHNMNGTPKTTSVLC